LCAVYLGRALMLEGAAGKVILPVGKRGDAHDTPGHRMAPPIGWALGEPGVRHVREAAGAGGRRAQVRRPANRFTTPSNCQSGFGASPVAVRTWKKPLTGWGP